MRMLHSATTSAVAGLVLICASVGCGGKISADGTSSGSGSGSGSGVGASPTGGTPTSSPPSPGVPIPTKPPGKPDPDPGKPANVVFVAHATPGGYDHLEIYKADFTNDRCTKIHLVSPSSQNPNGAFQYVVTEPNWSVQSVYRSPGAKNCQAGVPQKTIEIASDGKGSIDWIEDLKVFPCKVNVHVGIVWDTNPTFESFDTDDLSVDGC